LLTLARDMPKRCASISPEWNFPSTNRRSKAKVSGFIVVVQGWGAPILAPVLAAFIVAGFPPLSRADL
jgi:hypothetical protein